MILKLIKTIWNSIFFNLKAFPLNQALKFRVLVGPYVNFGQLHKGCIVLLKPHFACVRLGLGGGSFKYGDRYSSYINISKGSKITIEGSLYMARGFVFNFTDNSQSFFGDKFSANYGSKISIARKFVCGRNLRLGWNVSIIDADGHIIKSKIDGTVVNAPQNIQIGNDVWLAADSVILKGVHVNNGVIVPYGSIITKSTSSDYVIWGGVPNRILKNNIFRDYETES